MPVADIAEARDLVMGLFKTKWSAQAPPVPIVGYQDKKTPGIPPADGSEYVEAEIQHMDDRPAGIGDTGRKRFRAFARLIVDIRTPFGDGLTRSDQLVKIIQSFRGSTTAPDRVQFRRVTVGESGKDGNYYKVRMFVYFDYDEVVETT